MMVISWPHFVAKAKSYLHSWQLSALLLGTKDETPRSSSFDVSCGCAVGEIVFICISYMFRKYSCMYQML